jgi:uncharacterized membrane protein YdjX (TVP38/TMEM64 family)
MKSRPWRFALGGLVAAGIALALLERERFAPAAIEAGVARLGPWGPLAFIGVYLVAPALFLPGSVLTLAGGALFGVVNGAALSLVGATGGASVAFLIARHLAGDWVERRASGRLQEIKAGVEREGWRFVAFVRLVPVFPFNLLNYALGLTRIPLTTFAATSFVTMAPGAVAYAYLGYVGREAVTGGSGLLEKGLLAVGLLAALALLPSLVRRWRAPATIAPEELRERLSRPDPPLVLDVRGAEEYSGELGHIEGSLRIPIADLEARLAELAPHRGRLLVPV